MTEEYLAYSEVHVKTSGLPESLFIRDGVFEKMGEDERELCISDLLKVESQKTTSYARDYELLSMYTDKKIDIDRRQAQAKQDKQAQDDLDMEIMERKISAAVQESNTTATTANTTNTITTAAALATASAVAATPLPTHDETVAAMAAKTGQDRDVCFFYLESVNWELQAACDLLTSMQGA